MRHYDGVAANSINGLCQVHTLKAYQARHGVPHTATPLHFTFSPLNFKPRRCVPLVTTYSRHPPQARSQVKQQLCLSEAADKWGGDWCTCG